MTKCSVCGTELEEGQKFCFECGAPVPQTKKCIKCGAEIALKMKFCPECGTNQNGEANAVNTGFSMGDKNVIAGDVIGHKEETHVAGNATIIKNEDQTKQVKKCHVCGSLVQIVEGFDCPECGQFTCQNCYDEKDGCCTACAEKKADQKIARYKEALRMVLSDGRIEFSERKELISLQQELGISAEKAKQLEDEMKNAGSSKNEITTFEQVSINKAADLFYKEGKVKDALQLLEPVYHAHKHEEKVLDIYLPILAESDQLNALDVINNLQIDILTAFVVSIGIYIKQKNLVEAEKRLNQALRIWHESPLLKCYNVLFNYAMYKQFNDSSFLDKARTLSDQLGEAQTELELSFQVKVQTMLQEAVGENVVTFDKDFCEQNHLYWFIMNTNLLINVDKSNITVGKKSDCDFSVIQEALDYAEEDAVIHIKPGVYNEQLSFNKKVHLIGSQENIAEKASKDLPIVVLDSSKTCEINVPVEIIGLVFTYSNTLSFTNLKDFKKQKNKTNIENDEKIADSLLWVKSDATLKNIAIVNDCNYETYDIKFSANAATLEDSIILSPMKGVVFVEKSNSKIMNCKISSERQCIVLKDNSRPEITNCEFMNSIFGLSALDSSYPSVKNCEICHTDFGICISSNIGGKYEDCSIHDIGCYGVSVDKTAAPFLKNCEIYNTEDDAVYIYENATGNYESCSIHNSKEHGLMVEDSAAPLINNCHIYDNSKNGISIRGMAKGKYENCKIHDNKTPDAFYIGVIVYQNAEPKIKNCEIYNHLSSGIKIADDAGGTYEDCYIHNNVGFALDIVTSKKIDDSTCYS